MPNYATDIADYFVEKSLATAEELTPMKLVKLVYIAHGWNLGLFGDPLLNEGVQAWKFGPVVPSVYRAFKQFGADQVTSLYGVSSISEGQKPILNRVWEVYKEFTGGQLSTMTHRPGTPWATTVAPYEGRELPHGLLIANDLIKQHYQELANAGRTVTTNQG